MRIICLMFHTWAPLGHHLGTAGALIFFLGPLGPLGHSYGGYQVDALGLPGGILWATLWSLSYHLVTTGNTLGLLKDYLVNIVGACLCTVVVVVDVNFYSFCLSEVGYVWRRLSWQAGTLSRREKADEEGRRLCTCAQQIVRGLNPCQVEKTRSILWVVWCKA